MGVNEIIKKVMKEEKIGQCEMAEKLGVSQAAISRMLNRPGMSCDSAEEILGAMGYKLVAVKETVVE